MSIRSTYEFMRNLILTVLALVLCTSALAGGDKAQFDKLDANKDGVLDEMESGQITSLGQSFKTADENGDGNLDRQEFSRALADLRGAEKADTDQASR